MIVVTVLMVIAIGKTFCFDLLICEKIYVYLFLYIFDECGK